MSVNQFEELYSYFLTFISIPVKNIFVSYNVYS